MRREQEPPLDIDWHTPGLELTEAERAEALDRLPRLRRAVRELPVRIVHVEVERNPRKGGWGVSVALALPHRSLFAAEWARSLGFAGRRAWS